MDQRIMHFVLRLKHHAILLLAPLRREWRKVSAARILNKVMLKTDQVWIFYKKASRRQKKEVSFLLWFLVVFALSIYTIQNIGSSENDFEEGVQDILFDSKMNRERSLLEPGKKSFFTTIHRPVDVSVVVLTYKKHLALAKLLPSILEQEQCNFEIIIADNGCFEDTKKVIHAAFDHDAGTYAGLVNRHKYLPLCNNPGYAAGNNAAVDLASPASDRILFLNDDIVLGDSKFIYNMLQLSKLKETSAAVGCKILNANGTEIIEAGSIVWEDASAGGYGRERKDINATEFSYAKPVDYVSGACLMVEKKVFTDYAGFDGVHFPNYYDDTDVQMHIQHDLGKEVWLQPKSVALHDEHGSFGNDESEKLMQAAAEKFRAKWKGALNGTHLKNPWDKDTKEQEKAFFLASDLRARDPTKANILYIDDNAPNKSRGSGYGRAFDNLSMIAELGHRVTLTTLYLPSVNDWCDESCIDEITSLGIEYETKKSWSELFQSRIGFYDVVIVSRPYTLRRTFRQLREFYQESTFSLIYDSEALAFLRDERLEELVNGARDIKFPGYWEMESMPSKFRPELRRIVMKAGRQAEVALLSLADTVLTVSDGEKNLVSQYSPETKDIDVIGHIMESDQIAHGGFTERQYGILFVASFTNSMYYNGDAIWYFLKEVYPLVISESKSSSKPIPPLTIAGRGIPDELRRLVEANDDIAPHVNFLESPPTLDSLFAQNLLFIAPHLYGAGIQYKVSEALSMGLPVVMSKFTYDSFGDNIPGCVGPDDETLAKCIIDLHGDQSQWTTLQKDGISYISQTHSRQRNKRLWSYVIKRNLNTANIKNKDGQHFLDVNPKAKCKEGEEKYFNLHQDVSDAVSKGIFSSAFDHWYRFGKAEGRQYTCKSRMSRTRDGHDVDHNLLNFDVPRAKGRCDEGEEIYFSMYKDAADFFISYPTLENAFEHWTKWGELEGRQYFCNTMLDLSKSTIDGTRRSIVQMNDMISLEQVIK